VTRGQAVALSAIILLAGGGGYLYFAKKNGWWPFKEEVPGGPGAPNPPGQPTVEVTVTGPNTAEAVVSWNPVPGATYYKVYRDGQEVLSNVRGTTATLTGLVPGQTYQIAIAACN